MLKQNLIEESGERPDAHLDDEHRRYYRITAFGLPERTKFWIRALIAWRERDDLVVRAALVSCNLLQR